MTVVGSGEPVEIEGTVQGVQRSGFGRNSGELTLTLNPPGGVTQVFAGIMDSNFGPNDIEHGVFASYVTIASAAMTPQRVVRCSYLIRDKLRMNSLSLL